MFTSAVDFTSSCLVGLHSGKSSDDVDFGKSVAALESLHRRGIAPTGAVLLIVDEGAHIPSSRLRRKFAEVRAISRPHRIAFITESRLARGVLTAIDWIQPPGPEHQTKAWATVEEGILWLEEERHERLPMLRALYRDARALARKGREAALPPAGPAPPPR